MARIAGVNIPTNKRVLIGLQYIHGIGQKSARDIITKVDDHLIAGSDSLVATIRAYRPGDTVTLTWTHSGKTKTAKVTLDSDASTSNS